MPPVVADHRNAPVNALGYLRAMFTVEDIEACRGAPVGRRLMLIDEYMPRWHVRERHRLSVRASPADAFAAIRTADHDEVR